MSRSLLVLTTMFVLACSPSSPDDSGEEETSDTGDGDGDTGDGDGDTGDGDGDGDGDTGDGDGDLESLCMTGCTHTFECAPTEVMMYYADIPECVTDCLGLWAACVPEGSAYIDCVLALECADVVTLLTDGPSASACGGPFDAAQAACMNG